MKNKKKAMNKKKVSVIIPTYKATERLDRAIESVLDQTYKNFEIIVVDDNDPASPARAFTEELMKKYGGDGRIKYLKHEKNKNGAAARNTGLAAATGELIAFLDDDDEYYPKRLERCVGTLEEHDDFDSVYTDCDMYKDDAFSFLHKATESGNVWREMLLNDSFLGTGSNLFFRRNCLDDVIGFDERFVRFQDVEFMIRIVERHKLFALNETLVKKNLGTANMPEYYAFRQNRLLIFDKFAYLIEKLTEEEQKDFYRAHYDVLLGPAIATKDRKAMRLAYKELSRYKKLSKKLKFACYYPKIYGLYVKIFKRG